MKRSLHPRGVPARAGKEGAEPVWIWRGHGRHSDRGLLFGCVNSDFERQFEFVQHTWLDNGFFAGLSGEVDPVAGPQPEGGGGFTVAATPVRRRFTGVPRFVTTVGGAYFFLPGIRALEYLAALEVG